MQLNDPQQRGNEKKALEVKREAYPPAKDLDDSRRSVRFVGSLSVFSMILIQNSDNISQRMQPSPSLTRVNASRRQYAHIVYAQQKSKESPKARQKAAANAYGVATTIDSVIAKVLHAARLGRDLQDTEAPL